MELTGKEVEELLGFYLPNREIISCLEKMRYGGKIIREQDHSISSCLPLGYPS